MSLNAETLVPNLMVDNITDTVDFYTNKLGFRLNMSVTEDKTGFHDQLQSDKDYIWAHVINGPVEIMLQRRDSFERDVPALQGADIGAAATIYIRVKQVSSLFQQYTDAGIDVVKPLQTTWYGMKEFYITDNNGYVLCFGEMDETVQM
ncbi:MAG: VOC family protein [Arenicella sp.]